MSNQTDTSSISDSLRDLKAQLYAELGGNGAMKELADEMDEPYAEVVKAISDATVSRIEEAERILSE